MGEGTSAARWPPPLMADNPRPMQVILVGVVPALFGAITGIFLGISEAVYLVLSILGVLGGVGAGFDHVGARSGALRGLLAGFLFGAFILIAHEIAGQDAKAHLPEPAVVLVAVTSVLGCLFGAIGGAMRARVERG